MAVIYQNTSATIIDKREVKSIVSGDYRVRFIAVSVGRLLKVQPAIVDPAELQLAIRVLGPETVQAVDDYSRRYPNERETTVLGQEKRDSDWQQIWQSYQITLEKIDALNQLIANCPLLTIQNNNQCMSSGIVLLYRPIDIILNDSSITLIAADRLALLASRAANSKVCIGAISQTGYEAIQEVRMRLATPYRMNYQTVSYYQARPNYDECKCVLV